MAARVDAASVRPRTLIFDCDGVLLDSNEIKTRAFGEVARHYGADAEAELVAYHREHAGVSRFDKFRYLLRDIVGTTVDEGTVEMLSTAFGDSVSRQLLNCPVADGLDALREQTADMGWMMVSGGAQEELREVFAARGLARLFDLGIFGSPDDKDTIFAREQEAGRLQRPALYVGDSRYDHEAATRAGFGFVFVSAWTNFAGWREYCAARGLRHVASVAELALLPELAAER